MYDLRSLAICASMLMLWPGDLPAQNFMDATYGDSGWVLTDIAGGHDMYYDLALQPDGKLLAAGFASGLGDASNVLVSRYDETGAFDPAWSNNGHNVFQPNGQPGEARSVVLLQDDRVLVAGWALLNGHPHVMVARLTDSGALDPTFGVGGSVGYEIGDSSLVRDMVVQDDGRILLCGIADIDDYPEYNQDYAHLLMRLNADGALDSSFADNGVYLSDPSIGGDNLRGIALQPDQKIITVGDTGWWYHACVLRFNIDGSLDTSFGGGDGSFNSSYYGHAVAVSVLPDGGILVGGVEGIVSNYDDATLWKLNSTGVPDTTFGNSGMTYVEIAPDRPLFTSAMLVQDDERIILGGVSIGADGYPYEFFLLRFSPAGEWDDTFGDNGIIWSTPHNIQNGDYVMGLVREPSGRFLLGGHWYNNIQSDAAMAAIVPGTVGLEENAPVRGVSVFPNPADDQLDLVFRIPYRSEVSLADAMGRVVKTIMTDPSGKTVVKTNELQNGCYWLILRNGDRSSATPFVVQH